MSWVTERLKEEVLVKDWTGTLPNEIYEFNNIYNKLQYQPSSTYEELLDLNEKKASLEEIILNIPNIPVERLRPLLEHVSALERY